MRKSIVLTLALLLWAGMAWGAAGVWNGQAQIQDNGGFGIAGPPGAASFGGGYGGQLQGGIGAADPGDVAADTQTNGQVQGASWGDGFGPNFSGGGFVSEQQQDGGGVASGGIYGYGGAQAGAVGSGGFTVGGQAAAAGSAGVAGGVNGAFALGGAIAGQEQSQTFQGGYAQQSTSANGGYIYQEGDQTVHTDQAVGAAIVGGAYATSGVAQFGGTAALNDGQGQAMAGSGAAAGDATASAGAVGLAGAEANAYGEQTHSYEQFSQNGDGSSQQFQAGTVYTQVNASATD